MWPYVIIWSIVQNVFALHEDNSGILQQDNSSSLLTRPRVQLQYLMCQPPCLNAQSAPQRDVKKKKKKKTKSGHMCRFAEIAHH